MVLATPRMNLGVERGTEFIDEGVTL